MPSDDRQNKLRDLLFDLYDEGRIGKAAVSRLGQIESESFYDLLLDRRRRCPVDEAERQARAGFADALLIAHFVTRQVSE